ncbi:alpha/beta hydrolase [Thalassospira mesophila]|uniref:Phospholipase n=1 Tax=Thalassospira mesophila TaxID=1293891 RepID=A0A1Y2L1K9_9PROT|nr:alpha/beta fold hydrolase [Thalassospira mesophila]OSQ38807.1 phospholipase [Thalassospira mesophila]
MSNITLEGPTFPAASGNTKSIVILLHGYGADGNDLIGLAPELAKFLPDTVFYAPNAPHPCEMSPFGRQWFSLASYDPEFLRRDADTMPAALKALAEGARENTASLAGFIGEVLAAHQLTAANLALVGFSQGTMMALQLGPRHGDKLAGIVGFSGALLGNDTLAGEIVSRPPVTLIHGSADPVVPIQASRMALTALKENGFDVTLHERPGLPHGIDGEGLTIAADFLKKHLS